jgi:hypothetical protein
MLIDSLRHQNLLLPGHVRAKQIRRTAHRCLGAVHQLHGASTGSSRKSLVKDRYYQDNNLAENNIYTRDFYEELPKVIAGLIDHVYKERDSPGLSSDQLRPSTRL